MRTQKDVIEAEVRDLHASYWSGGATVAQAAAGAGVGLPALTKLFRRFGLPIKGRGTKGSRVKPTITEAIDDSPLLAFKADWDRLDSTVKGAIAESYAKVRLAEQGFDVWEPVAQNHRTDMIILFGRSMLRIQVKSATYDPKTKRFRANTTRHRRGAKERRFHDNGDVDYFVIYCGGLPQIELYVIPSEVIGTRPCLNLVPNRDKYSNFHNLVSWESYRNAFHLLREAGHG